MTRTDRRILRADILSLFRAKTRTNRHKTERVLKLAGLVEAFCMEHVPSMLWPTADETGSSVIDQLIERHINELRASEQTVLPVDRATLIDMLDRLQQRKIRCMRRGFYASATDNTIANLVLKFLDEEIVAEGDTKLA